MNRRTATGATVSVEPDLVEEAMAVITDAIVKRRDVRASQWLIDRQASLSTRLPDGLLTAPGSASERAARILEAVENGAVPISVARHLISLVEAQAGLAVADEIAEIREMIEALRDPSDPGDLPGSELRPTWLRGLPDTPTVRRLLAEGPQPMPEPEAELRGR